MRVDRLAKGGTKLETWAGKDGSLGAKGGVLDGISVLGDRVLVNALMTSKLFAVPIAADGAAGKVVTVKEGFPDGPVAVTVVGTTAYVLEGQLGLLLNPPKPGETPPPSKPYKATAVEVGAP